MSIEDQIVKILIRVINEIKAHEALSEITEMQPYDWWRTRDGNYAKVARVELEGEIYGPTGQKITGEWYNPYSLKATGNSSNDLENRKSGEAKGWPEWTK